MAKNKIWEHSALSNIDTSFTETRTEQRKTYLIGNIYVPKQHMDDR